MQLNDYTRYRVHVRTTRNSIMETRDYYPAITDLIRIRSTTLAQGLWNVFDAVADAIDLERFIVIEKDKCETR